MRQPEVMTLHQAVTQCNTEASLRSEETEASLSGAVGLLQASVMTRAQRAEGGDMQIGVGGGRALDAAGGSLGGGTAGEERGGRMGSGLRQRRSSRLARWRGCKMSWWGSRTHTPTTPCLASLAPSLCLASLMMMVMTVLLSNDIVVLASLPSILGTGIVSDVLALSTPLRVSLKKDVQMASAYLTWQQQPTF